MIKRVYEVVETLPKGTLQSRADKISADNGYASGAPVIQAAKKATDESFGLALGFERLFELNRENTFPPEGFTTVRAREIIGDRGIDLTKLEPFKPDVRLNPSRSFNKN